MRRGAKPAKAKVEAKPPSARKPWKNEGSRDGDLEKRLAEAQRREAEALEQVQARNRELAEAREQLTGAHAQVSESHEEQTATSEILRVISSSPTDVQPVFEAVLASGVRLCGARFGGVFRFDGHLIHLVTSYEWPEEHLVS
jgi:hypothetical protein